MALFSEERASLLDNESAHRWFLFLLLGLTLLYAPLLLADYAWDDEALVLARQAALNQGTALAGNGDLWMAVGEEARQSGYYRPAFLWSLDLDSFFGAGKPGLAHMHSLAWHLAAVLGLYLLLTQLFSGPAALLGTALFAFHPVQSEAVAWIAARNDMMASAFGFMAMAALLPTRAPPVRLALGGLFLLGALLSKEHAVAFVLLFFALDWVRRGRPKRSGRIEVVVGVVVVYVGLRIGASLDAPSLQLPSVLDVCNVVGHYLSLIVIPQPLSVSTTLDDFAWSPRRLVGCTLGVSAAAAMCLRGGRFAGLGLLFAAVAFLPALFSVGAVGQLGDRFLYLPLAGVGMALAAGLPEKLPARRTGLGLVVLILVGSLLVSDRLPDWRDSESLWTAEVEISGTPYAHANLANVLHRQGRLNEALPQYLQSLEVPAPRLDRCGDTVRLALALGDAQRGLDLVERAYAAGCPKTPRREGIRALLLVGLQRFVEAEEVARQNPEDPLGRSQLVLALAAQRVGNEDEVANYRAQYAQRGVSAVAFDAMLKTLSSPSAGSRGEPLSPPSTQHSGEEEEPEQRE